MEFIPLIILLLSSGMINTVLSLASIADTATTPSATTKRIALVTGANKGIGKEIVRLLGKEKDIITILTCRSPDPSVLETIINDLQEKDACTDLHFIPSSVDLTKPDTFDGTVRKFIEDHFDGRLDILVNNAAVCFNDPTLYGAVDFTPFEQQARISVDTNFWGTWRLIQSLTPCLDKSSSPRLINVASSAGRLGILKSKALIERFTSDELTIDEIERSMREFVELVENGTHRDGGWPDTCYGMSKLGLIALTRVLARQHGSRWMCNTVDPGYCATDQNQNQGNRPAARGAVTPFLLATLPDDQFHSGLHWFDERTMEWSYNQF